MERTDSPSRKKKENAERKEMDTLMEEREVGDALAVPFDMSLFVRPEM